MSTDYTGNPAAVQAPSPAPGPGIAPILRMPGSGDAGDITSIVQMFKTLADGEAWLMQNGAGSAGQFGDGSDGALTFDGSATVLGMAPVSHVYTLTRDIFATNLTLSSAIVTIKTNGWRIYCTGTLTTNGGGIRADGASGVLGAAGAAGAVRSIASGSAGGAGQAGAGSAGNNIASTLSYAGNGASGGAGSSGAGGTGGTNGGAITAAAGTPRLYSPPCLARSSDLTTAVQERPFQPSGLKAASAVAVAVAMELSPVAVAALAEASSQSRLALSR